MCSELLTKQSKYAKIEKKSLAIIFGITKFRKHLVGHKFTIYMDHKALTYLFGENKGIPMTASARVTRWLCYEYSVQYKLGKEFGKCRWTQPPSIVGRVSRRCHTNGTN